MQRVDETFGLLRKEHQHTINQMNDFARKVEKAINSLDSRVKRAEAGMQQLYSLIETTSNRQTALLKEAQDEKASSERYVSCEQKLLCKQTLCEHSERVLSLSIARNMMISGAADGTIKIWDTKDKNEIKCIKTLESHSGAVLALTAIGKKLFTGGKDSAIKLWDLETGKCERTLCVHDSDVCSIAVGCGYLFSGSYQRIIVLDIETLNVIATIDSGDEWTRALCVCNGFLYSGAGNTIRKWDLVDFSCVASFCVEEENAVYSMECFENHLLVGTSYSTIEVLDIETLEFERQLDSHNGTVHCIKALGNKLFSGASDCTIKVLYSSFIHRN